MSASAPPRPGRRRAIAVAVAATAALTATTSFATWPATARPSPGPDHGQVAIRRTEYGIPHILASNYYDLGFGDGYAFAQDDLCTMADHVITLRGERSRFFGANADSGDQEEPPSTNLASDVYYRTVLSTATIRRLLARPAPLGPTSQVRRLVAGYVAGYDRYLRRTGVAHLPDPTCRGAAWVGPITSMDIWRNVYDLTRLAGTGQFKQAIASATPPGNPAMPVRPARESLARTVSTLRSDPIARAEIGSNAIALGRDATIGRTGMLLANPHFPWSGPLRFYQAQLTIPGQLNVTGASLFGTPVVEVGHTGGLAFTGTISTAQRFTLYQLSLVPGHPASYLMNGHAVPMSRQSVTVPVRGADGRLSQVRRTVYGTRFGPVIGSGWTATTAFAVDDANASNLRLLNEFLAIDRSASLGQLRAAQNAYQAIPWSNTIAADASGHAYFADASVVPHVTDAEASRCVSTPQGRAAYPDPTILNGSTSACGWGSDKSAIQPGIFGPAREPRLTRQDYVTNSNDSPWLANPAEPLTGYPRIYGDFGTARSLRTRLGARLITDRLHGTDGLGRPGFTMANLERVLLNDDNYSADLGLPGIVRLCRAHPVLRASDGQPVNVTRACQALAAWNGRDDTSSRGAVLWREFWLRASQVPHPFSVPFAPGQPLTTPNTLDAANSSIQAALADAVVELRRLKLPLNLALGSAQRVTEPRGSIPVEGCDDNEGCFNVASLAPGRLGANGRYPNVTEGSSFIMVVEFGRTEPRAATILTYSESANPDSPHHSDQTVLYSRKQWVPDRFTQAQIAADPGLKVLLLTP